MRSICFFCSYYTGNKLPEYVKFYLLELKKHFSEMIMVTNEKEMPINDIAFLKDNEITHKPVVNEGYDFGMYYKMFKEYNIINYDRVGLINDSCILFKSLDGVFEQIDNKRADYYSLTDSYEIRYHLQSYFIIINKKAIPFVLNYFNSNGIVKDFWQLVQVYEAGLSNYLLNSGLTLEACYPVKKNRKGNPAYLDAKYLIKEGFPVVKKKIFLLPYQSKDWNTLVMQGFVPYSRPYIKLIQKMTRADFPANIFSEFIPGKSLWNKIKFTSKFIFLYIFGFLWRMLAIGKRSVIKSGNRN